MAKFFTILFLTLGLALSPLGAGAADGKIGVVDSNDIVAKSPEGKRAQETLKKRSDDLGRPLGQKRQDLARQVEEFQKQASVMKEEARKRKAEELEKKMKDWERQGQEAEKELAQLQEKELGPILKKLEAAVKAVAEEQKLDVVMDKTRSGLLFMDPKVDITEKVRSRFGK